MLDNPQRSQPVCRSRNVLQCLPIFAHSGAGIRDHISSQIPVPKMGPPCCRTIRFTTKGRNVVPFSVPESGPRNGPAFRSRRAPKSRSQGLQKPAPCRRNLAADGWQTSHVAKSHWAHEKRIARPGHQLTWPSAAPDESQQAPHLTLYALRPSKWNIHIAEAASRTVAAQSPACRRYHEHSGNLIFS